MDHLADAARKHAIDAVVEGDGLAWLGEGAIRDSTDPLEGSIALTGLEDRVALSDLVVGGGLSGVEVDQEPGPAGGHLLRERDLGLVVLADHRRDSVLVDGVVLLDGLDHALDEGVPDVEAEVDVDHGSIEGEGLLGIPVGLCKDVDDHLLEHALHVGAAEGPGARDLLVDGLDLVSVGVLDATHVGGVDHVLGGDR